MDENYLLQLQTLCDPFRWKLMEYLCAHTEAITPTLLCSVFGKDDGYIGYHLRPLLKVGLVVRIPSGRNVLYVPNRKLVLELSTFVSNLIKKDEPPCPPSTQSP